MVAPLHRKTLAAASLALVLVSCGDDTSTRTGDQAKRDAERQAAREKRESTRQAEIALMANTTQAGDVLKQRLIAHLTRIGPVIIVRDQRLPNPALEGLPERKDFTVAALPLNTPWIVKCTRQGISVVFGALASGDVSSGDGSIDADLAVELTTAPMTRDQCEELVPQVASVMIVAGKP